MIDMDVAWQLILSKSRELVSQRSSPLTCVKDLNDIKPGDILAEHVTAVDDLPPFRASVMDGYAIDTL